MIPAFAKQLNGHYRSYLKNLVAVAPFSPIVLRGEKMKPQTTVELHQAISAFQQFEKKPGVPGWEIEWESWFSRKLGAQQWPSRILINSEEDYLFLLKKETEVAAFKTQLQRLLHWQPAIQQLLLSHPEMVLQFSLVWEQLMATTDYLLNHEVRGLYLRSIAVPAHTKFIGENKSTIIRLLNCIAPDRFPAGDAIEATLQLKTKPALYLMRWLDPDLASQYTPNMEFFAIPIDVLSKNNWNVAEIWLVENETNLYLLPRRKEALAVFSRGYAMEGLKEIPLFRQTRLFYWGDLDEDGFIMLNRMRWHYPKLKSVFMGESTLINHAAEFDRQPANYKTAANSLDLLTPTEKAAFNILKHHNGRLEQERIRQDYIWKKLSRSELG